MAPTIVEIRNGSNLRAHWKYSLEVPSNHPFGGFHKWGYPYFWKPPYHPFIDRIFHEINESTGDSSIYRWDCPAHRNQPAIYWATPMFRAGKPRSGNGNANSVRGWKIEKTG